MWTLLVLQLALSGVGVLHVRQHLLKCSRTERALIPDSLRAWRLPLVLIAAMSAWFAYIFHTHSLLQVGKDFHVGGSTYGDMPFHLNIISSFLHGVNQHANVFKGFTGVFFADSKLVYPFLPDWYTAVLMGAGRCVV